MKYMPFFLYALSAMNLFVVIMNIRELIARSKGWRYVHSALDAEMKVDIPKAGRYSICVRRSLKTRRVVGSLGDAFPEGNFIVSRPETNVLVSYHVYSGDQTGGLHDVTQDLGYFDAPEMGTYFLQNLDVDRFLQADDIVIREYLYTSVGMRILGIVGFSGLCLMNIINASQMLFGGR